jgi:hypothetical protein
MSEWETFCDVSYYHLWRVRRKTERGFDDGFHLESGEEARDLVELLNRMERERVEAQEDLEFRRGLYKVQEECLEAARRERSDAIRQFENLKATAIHTCHDQCQRPMCVLRRERDEAREALRELWQTADAYIPQIDEEQATKWHHAMFGNSKNG